MLGDPSPLPTDYIPQLLEIRQAARRLSFSEGHLRLLIREGKFPVIRFGRRLRVDARDVTAYIQAHRHEARTEARTPAIVFQHPRGVSDAG